MACGVALAHDYVTQRGGAERVVLNMAAAFDDAPLYTTLYDPAGTFPEFAGLDIRVSPLDRIGVLRRAHRLAMPLLAHTVSNMTVDADVLLVSSSGWAHGMRTSGRKIVYCHTPARWLYQRDRYLGAGRRGPAAVAASLALDGLGRRLRQWDRAAALSADRYLANSTVTRDAIKQVYGIEAQVVPPPPALLPDGPQIAVDGTEPGFLLCVARLLPYKNVDAVIDAVAQMPGARLVVVGSGPDSGRLAAKAATTSGVKLLGRVDDAQLRWLYANCSALVAASYEDYGLSPLEAASFGKPSVVLRAGGYLDTVIDGRTGVFFDEPMPGQVAAALDAAASVPWDERVLCAHAETFSADRFEARLREIVAAEATR